jgi:hypothetical protein
MKTPIVYIYLYGMIKRKINGNVVKIKEIKSIISWWVRLPKSYLNIILKEMEFYNLLKRLGRDNYEILCSEQAPPLDSLGEPLW